jgi:hypothetical protein
MRVKKDSHEYVCVFLKPGYFETGVLGDYFSATVPDVGKPAYFWTDNIDSDELGNYRVRLKRLSGSTTEEDVYIPHEYVLLVTAQKAKGNPKPDTRKIGFVLPPADETEAPAA